MKAARVRLGQIASLDRRPVPVESGMVYKTFGLLNRGRGVFERPAMAAEDIKYTTLYRVVPGQLVFSKLFAWEGSVAIVPEDADDFYVSPEFPTFTLDTEIADSSFVRHLIGWEGLVSQLASSTSGLGQRRQRVNVGAFEAITVPLPSLVEQRRIAQHLDKVGEVAANSASAGNVEAHWRAVVEQLAGSASSQDSVPLRSVLSERSGEPVLASGRYPITGVYSFGKGLLSREPILGRETKYATMTRLRRDDVVYSKLGAFEGAVGIVTDEFDGSFVSPEFPVFQVAPTMDPRFLRYCFVSSSFVEQLGSATSGVGARQKRVSPTAFLSLRVPARSPDEQAEIAALLDRMTEALELSKRADALASALLPAARNKIFAAL